VPDRGRALIIEDNRDNVETQGLVLDVVRFDEVVRRPRHPRLLAAVNGQTGLGVVFVATCLDFHKNNPALAVGRYQIDLAESASEVPGDCPVAFAFEVSPAAILPPSA
jgi:hypothetical protein